LTLQGRDVLIVKTSPATGTNSRLGSEGKGSVYGYCEPRIHHRRCGKLIGATEPNPNKTVAHHRRPNQRNGVTDQAVFPCMKSKPYIQNSPAKLRFYPPALASSVAAV